jgi:cobalt/nickel transport system permease protein
LFSYLRRNEPALVGISSLPPLMATTGAARKLWPALAVILLMTPLGILASGAAWGEWAPKDFSNAATRTQIAAASGSALPPTVAPSGLGRLANLWTAPLPDYAPHFVKSAAFGYLLSAMFGVGLILAVTWLAQRMSLLGSEPANQRREP